MGTRMKSSGFRTGDGVGVFEPMIGDDDGVYELGDGDEINGVAEGDGVRDMVGVAVVVFAM